MSLTHRLAPALVAVAMLTFVPRRAGAQPSDTARGSDRVVARIASGPIDLDGRLDDSAWAAADSIVAFLQREPSEGVPATERTVAKVLRDDLALYVGMRLEMRDTAAIVATEFRRDAELDVNDNAGFILDTYDEQRTAFGFATNPNGMMWDGQLTGTQDWNVDWNAVWDVVVTRDAHGWTAEFRIPFRALRFRDGADVVFGFNIQRFIRSKNEEDLWRSWKRNQGIEQLQLAGDLVIAGPLRRGTDLEIWPNAIATYQLPSYDSLGRPADHAVPSFKAGMNAKLAVSPTMTADLTVNADFAEVEADSQVINLTRFPVFFPEKREFFLESAGLFTFGAVSPTRNTLYYSRNIGLTADGTPVPIVLGARVYGDAGPWAIGALATRTGDPDDAVDAVIRLRRNVLDRSYIGAIATVHTGPGVGAAQSAAGVDLDFPLVLGGQNLEPKFWIAGTRNPGVPGTPISWRAYVDYPNDIWDNFVALYHVDRGYLPALGFVLLDGIDETNGHVDWMPRPSSGAIRNWEFQFLTWDVIAPDSGTLGSSATWRYAQFDVRPFGFTLQSGDHVAIDIIRSLDAPDSLFPIFPSSVIPPGHYWWTQTQVGADLAPGRIVSGSLYVSWGTFYGGTATSVTSTVAWRTGGRFLLGGDFFLTNAHLPGGNFTAVQSALRLEYDFTTRLSLLGFAQHTNDAQRADFQVRLHWIPVIGDDVYVVWNSGYTTYPLAPWRFPSWNVLSRPLNGALVIKVSHRIPL